MTSKAGAPAQGERADTSAAPAPNEEMQAALDAHNRLRGEHCAPPLTWSSELAEVAQGWADELAENGCAFEHSRSDYGENLSMGTPSLLRPENVVQQWYDEVEQYDFSEAAFSMETGHFTQVVWADTRRLGCGTSMCKGMRIWVCNYDPPGNVHGQFRDNVRPRSCDD